MTLRPYQLDLVERVEDSTASSVLVVLPTGGGKTQVAEELTRRTVSRGGRVVFLADRQELVRQAHDRIGGAVLMGSLGRRAEDPSAAVTVASVATLARRASVPSADLVFADEAHLYAAASFRQILEAYRSSGARVVGLTATPARLDGQGLGELFDEVVQGPSTQDLISQGWLVPARTFAPTGPWWDSVSLRGGDFAAEDLARAASAVVRDVAARWRQLGGADRPTIVFAATKRHATELAEEFSGMDVGPAETVTDDTPASVRRSVRDRIQGGDLRVVVTVGVLGTGFDAPAVSCIVMARPTLSWSLYLQQGGRGLRPFPGKEDLLLVDAAGNSLRHGLLTKPFSVSLDGVRKLHRRAVAGLTTCRNCFRVYESSDAACPGCSVVRPVAPPRRLRTVDGQLVELTPAQAFAETAPPSRQIALLARWTREAREKGWKPGAPAARFRGMFGRWPTQAELEQARSAA
jgi:DNA repair protein RadD